MIRLKTYHEIHAALEGSKDVDELLDVASAYKKWFDGDSGDAVKLRNLFIAHLQGLNVKFSRCIECLSQCEWL